MKKPTSLPSGRLISLDVLRGLTICLMIIVNNPGSWEYVYPPLRHASWNGYTPTDLVFPFFMFIVGVSIFLSFSKLNSTDKKPVVFKIWKRTTLIFLLGLFLNFYPNFDFENLRIMGVLQRIALAYGLAATIVVFFKPKWILPTVLAILVAYPLILFGFGGEFPFSLEGNVERALDIKILGIKHMYGGYGIPFDPEGLLSTLPGIASVLLGYLCARFLTAREEIKSKMMFLIIGGLSLLVLGTLLNFIVPINKPIWSSSYVLVTTAWASLILAVLVYLIDFKGFKKIFMPFVHYGRNPLFIYVVSGIYISTIASVLTVNTSKGSMSIYNYLYSQIFVPIGGNLNGSLFFALFQALLFWFVAYLLYRKNIVIKV